MISSSSVLSHKLLPSHVMRRAKPVYTHRREDSFTYLAAYSNKEQSLHFLSSYRFVHVRQYREYRRKYWLHTSTTQNLLFRVTELRPWDESIIIITARSNNSVHHTLSQHCQRRLSNNSRPLRTFNRSPNSCVEASFCHAKP